jgi:hypothetical protein
VQVDPAELQTVKDALAANAMNLAVGLLHEPSGRIYLAPFDTVPGGHLDLVNRLGLTPVECRGFAIGKDAAGFVIANNSHMNGPQGQPGSLQMPQATFDEIVQTLEDAGL